MRPTNLSSTTPGLGDVGKKHPSYGNKPMPTMQLLAQLSKFDGRKKETIVDAMKLQEQANVML